MSKLNETQPVARVVALKHVYAEPAVLTHSTQMLFSQRASMHKPLLLYNLPSSISSLYPLLFTETSSPELPMGQQRTVILTVHAVNSSSLTPEDANERSQFYLTDIAVKRTDAFSDHDPTFNLHELWISGPEYTNCIALSKVSSRRWETKDFISLCVDGNDVAYVHIDCNDSGQSGGLAETEGWQNIARTWRGSMKRFI
ncbi:hypothetical protein M422DRAFT_51221 [Sphaerobolus stellatus SS14]|uniref:Uncharacterized protein n=1 Tax=Sphaerobolus stellatus (strain SS14) TaxID=990650 RepID=A0A0C9UMD4_SPHS4|nr:hypothetical protein M422DRAFT_51221 [Sphaerobolus stellatus SS14]